MGDAQAVKEARNGYKEDTMPGCMLEVEGSRDVAMCSWDALIETAKQPPSPRLAPAYALRHTCKATQETILEPTSAQAHGSG